MGNRFTSSVWNVVSRISALFCRRARDREFDEELSAHVDLCVQDNIERGLSPEEARRQALISLGGVEAAKEQFRDNRGLPALETLLRDVRYALRSLFRNPGFTLAALLALGLGIGASSAVFSVMNGVLLRPLPYTDPDRLVMIFDSFQQQGGRERGTASMADFLDWRARSRSFQAIDVFEVNAFLNSRFTLTGDGEAAQVTGLSVTATFFETLGIRPIIGRTFNSDEDQPGRVPTVVVSERLWQQRYASDPTVLGKSVILNGRAHTIIGVIPGSFDFWQQDVDAWAILSLNPPTRRGPFFLRGIGRLKAGISVEQAAAEMDGIARDVQRDNPKDYTRLRFPVIALREVVVGDIRPLLWVFSGAVVLVFMIAVSNVANLMLARATSRQREIAVRLSIGASRGRLVRQFMTESVMLSLIGGAIGTVLAIWAVAALHWLGPRDLPRLGEIAVDGRALGFTLMASFAGAVLFGLAPVITAHSTAIGDRLKDGGRAGESRRHGRVRAALVVAQVTFSVLLLVGAGLLVRSFNLLSRVSPGFQAPADRVLTMFISPTGPGFKNNRVLMDYWQQLLDRVAELPGVQTASLSIVTPPNRSTFGDTFEIVGKPLPPGEVRGSVTMPVVSHDYFKTLDIPLLGGRWFDDRDGAGTPVVTVISDALARRYFSGEDPVGQHLQYGGRTLEIIGVVGDVKYHGLDRDVQPIFYRLNAQYPFWDMWLLVRTQNDALAMADVVRNEIRSIDAGIPVERIGTLAQALSESVSLQRFRAVLMTVFAITALLLAAIGIYGVIAYSVVRRTQEIGVRMALGATPFGMLRLIVGQSSRLTAMGIALGLAGAFGLTRILEKMLFGVLPSDTITFGGAALVLGAVAIVASLVPAFRAARIDPVTTLRAE